MPRPWGTGLLGMAASPCSGVAADPASRDRQPRLAVPIGRQQRSDAESLEDTPPTQGRGPCTPFCTGEGVDYGDSKLPSDGVSP